MLAEASSPTRFRRKYPNGGARVPTGLGSVLRASSCRDCCTSAEEKVRVLLRVKPKLEVAKCYCWGLTTLLRETDVDWSARSTNHLRRGAGPPCASDVTPPRATRLAESESAVVIG